MISGNHDALSSQKDKRNVGCGHPTPEVMSSMGFLELGDCIETAILEVVRTYFATFSKDAEAVWKEQVKRQLRNKHGKRLRELQAKLEKLQRQQTSLRQEVVSSLSGDSTFDTQLLKSLLEENAAAVKEAESQLMECQNEKETEESRIQNMYEHFSRISAWRKEFDTADVETKKMILARIIEKITIEKG